MEFNEAEMGAGQVTDAELAGFKEPSQDDKEMFDILLPLMDTPAWAAIKRWNRTQDYQTLNALGSIDPFKFPVEIARGQGQRTGVFSLEVALMREQDRRKAKMDASMSEQG